MKFILGKTLEYRIIRSNPKKILPNEDLNSYDPQSQRASKTG